MCIAKQYNNYNKLTPPSFHTFFKGDGGDGDNI